MCIIVDANSAHNMKADNEDGVHVLRWLLLGGGKLVVSSDLLEELNRTNLKEILITLDRARRLVRADDGDCTRERALIVASDLPRSDDLHVIALVNSSGCELIYTKDQNLHSDLKNRQIVAHKCSIYQNADHRHLLQECRCA